MRKFISLFVATSLLFVVGCNNEVPQGKYGRISTSAGWTADVLKPGRYACYGYDKMYFVDTTSASYKETMNILVGGKVNLKVDVTIRVRISDDQAKIKKIFETIRSTNSEISHEKMYITFLQMKVLSIPRALYQAQPDVQSAVTNATKLEEEFKKRLMTETAETPLIVEDCQVTNYDWPTAITNAQEELVKVQLKEASAEAQVRADLKKAQGDLMVAEATKLVELKKAEAIAESINIISGRLAGCPEYLMWHQIKVMGEAAGGPNNCFILYPYNTDAAQVKQMVSNANLTQQLKDVPVTTTQKKVPAEKE
jgi:regulator of protease activity HflC (stomatin/prohibitin superfamily)